ncbi:uncharacterized protein LOC132722409 [Ruditapes philippinarum]|uniref:uncharacterized protein LOC132722409 n=1 Tax=Ruditapes philippinarum TaxID=129788 RepID=UPI00295AF732|nr:uncharacterized protein LOC132722409 [Ruditapes philippinarum]
MASGIGSFDGNFCDLNMFCDKHSSKTVDILCRDHDLVICSICASEKHITCVRLEPLTKESINGMKKKDFKHFGKDVSEMKRLLSNLKSKKLEDKKKLQEETEVAVKEVQEFRKLIDWVLDRMERKGKEYIEKRYKELNKVITEEIAQCEEMLTFLEKTKRHYKSTKDHSTVDQFVNMKKGKQMMEQALHLSDSMKNHKHREIVKFTVDPKVENFARNLSWFGKDRTYLSFEQPLSFPHLYEIKQHNQFDIRVKGDKQVCCVVDMCQLKDGTILAVDKSNRRLKQLDVLYQIVDSRDLPDDPDTVACVNENFALVASKYGVDTLIQFIQIKESLPLGDSFTVSGHCQGLSCSQDAVHVSTGDKISKFTLSGELLQEFIAGDVVQSFCLTHDFEKIVFTFGQDKLGVLNKNYQLCAEVQIQDLGQNKSLAVDTNGQILISMLDSHRIVQYNHDLQKLGEVVGPSDGIRNPQAIVFDRINNRLVVAMKYKNMIKAFDLK